jgi:hypothetical protein
MSLTLRLLIIYLCISFMIVPSLSQTQDELKKRYGAPDKRGCYKVRPGIILTVSGQENEQEYTVLVEPEEISEPEVISSTIAGQIIEELIPAPKRGRLIMAFTISKTDIAAYEKATIHLNKVCKVGEKCKITSIKIKRTQPMIKAQ